ncbi:MAG: nuclear transport factor 2 family protein [Muricauda sp.]|nr:nuclear transport factor 2 family protein [Allomuricauda sp.]MBA4745988.1 nuclear transport factor 2 family protein [Allomuricauda sp.]
MTKLIITTVLAVAVSFWGLAQESHTVQSHIQKIVERYFEGYAIGDSTVLKEVFHQDFRLSWKDPWRNQLTHVDRSGLFSFFDANWSKLSISSEINEIQVFNNSAYCRATVTLEGIVAWLDHINLLKLENGRWWIVSKVSEGRIIN